MIQPRRIYDLGLTHKAVAVYCYLCNRADKNGECYPSVRLISKDLSLSKSSVFRAFNELERNGLLQRLPRYHPSGARRSTLYALLAVGICLSANEVPRIAQMFGLDTSVRFNMISVSSTVSLGSRVAKAFTKK